MVSFNLAPSAGPGLGRRKCGAASKGPDRGAKPRLGFGFHAETPAIPVPRPSTLRAACTRASRCRPLE